MTTTQTLAEPELRALLVSVGASIHLVEELGRPMEELGLDSLARIELSSRIKDRYGVEVEDDLQPATTGLDIIDLVADRARSTTAAARS